MMLPSSKLLEKISRYVNQKGGKNYCLFLLGKKAGLRVNEAVNFSLEAKTSEPNFYLVRSKQNRFRSVYISQEVIQELKVHNWQPNSISRFGFYKFLRKTKKELRISFEIELTPHTLRRYFNTYHANNGVPLPVLQKALGHSSVRTTALYWKSEKEINNELVKEWLELNLERTPKITIEPEQKVVNHNLQNQEKLKKKRREKYHLNHQESLPIRKENKKLKEQNQQLVERIKELKKLISEQQEQEKMKAEIEFYKPRKIYG